LGIDPAAVAIVGVTKMFPPQVAVEAIKAGLKDLGENRVQEAAEKIPHVTPRPIWHLVGHLQKNKAKKAVELFDVIQSVDDIELARLISEQAGKVGKSQTIFLQVNSSYEPQKSGFDPAEIIDAAGIIKDLPNLSLEGLMTIGPLTDNREELAKSFGLTKAIFERIQTSLGPGFAQLSMGMSGDFEMALEYGANVLRIGTAIFGKRSQ
jgi:hypothetical protein